jgi:nucleoside-diphosphate-sugar epimerase
MKIAITGGTGFVGGHLARVLAADGHHVVLIARGADRRDGTIRHLTNATFHSVGTGDEDQLAAAFALCDAVAHCAGINREIGAQTYPRVHVQGTQHVVNGVVEPLPSCDDDVPDDLKPRVCFTSEQIRAGLPEAKPFGLSDCRLSFRARRA